MSDAALMIDPLFGVYTDPFSEVLAELNALRKRVDQLERTTEQKPHTAERTDSEHASWFIRYLHGDGNYYYTTYNSYISLKYNTYNCKSKEVRCKSREDADAVIRILNLYARAVLLNSVTMAPVEVTELNYD